MDSYSKALELNIKFDVDKQGKDKVTELIDGIQQEASSIHWIDKDALKEAVEQIKNDFSNFEIVKQGLIQGEDLKRASQAYQEQQINLLKIEKLKQEISELAMFDKDNEKLKAMQTELKRLQKQKDKQDAEVDKAIDTDDHSFFGGFKDGLTDWLKDVADLNQLGKDAFKNMKDTISDWAGKALDAIKSLVEDAIKEMKKMASWDIRGSSIFNSEAAEMYRSYGLSGAEAYGLSKGLDAIGFSSIDDFLSNIDLVNQSQLEYLEEVSNTAMEQYEQDLEVAKLFEEFDKEYAIFKQEMQKEVIDFFMENKDTIMSVMKGIFSLMETLVKATAAILDFFGGGVDYRSSSEKQQAIADMLGVSSTTNNSTTNTNVSINNTYNGVNKEDQTWLSNVGQLTYQQVIEALGRD